MPTPSCSMPSSLISGILPFGAVFVELFFILTVRYPLTLQAIWCGTFSVQSHHTHLHSPHPLSHPPHTPGHLGEPVLLPFWLSPPGVFNPHHRLLRGCHSDDLLPAVWGGLPLVVEVLPALGLRQLLRSGLLHHLLLHQGKLRGS